jgi:hypothetical protein
MAVATVTNPEDTSDFPDRNRIELASCLWRRDVANESKRSIPTLRRCHVCPYPRDLVTYYGASACCTSIPAIGVGRL